MSVLLFPSIKKADRSAGGKSSNNVALSLRAYSPCHHFLLIARVTSF
jgi:hypothetical protein